MITRALLLAFLAPVLAPRAAAETWTVDARGGACADFADIGPAVVNAASGDRIVVHPGRYAPVRIDGKSLTLLGVGSEAVLLDGLIVQNVPAADRVLVAGVEVPTVDLLACSGTVTLADVLVDRKFVTVSAQRPAVVWVDACADVRLHRVVVDYQEESGLDAIVVQCSRLEVAGGAVRAGQGNSVFFPNPPAPGRDAIVCDALSRLHVAGGELYGGQGAPINGGEVGDGGAGLQLFGEGIYAGDGGTPCVGGAAGAHIQDPAADGGHGAWIQGGGSLRHSGVAFAGGPPWGAGSPGLPIFVEDGSASTPAVPDPLIALVDPSVPTLRVHASAGAAVELLLGRQPTVVDDGVGPVEQLVVPLRAIDLGTVPAQGWLDADLSELSWAWGTDTYLQAAVRLAPGDVRRTNSTTHSLPDDPGADCDGNLIDDFCDIAAGGDCDANGVVDRCEAPPLVQVLAGADAGVSASFGRQVEVDDDRLIAAGIGPVASYRRISGAWMPEGSIVVGTGSFSAVALDGDRVALGNSSNDSVNGQDAGVVWLYQWSGADWVQESVVRPFNGHAGDGFGGDVALAGDDLLASAWGGFTFGYMKGEVYAFRRDAGGWKQVQRIIVPSDGLGSSFGIEVALDGERLAVGMRDNAAWPDLGALAVFERVAGAWTSDDVLRAPGFDGPPYDVTFAAGRLAAGAGSVFSFVQSAGGWVFDQQVDACTNLQLVFGRSLAADGARLAVGASASGWYAPGASYLFDAAGGPWIQRAELRGEVELQDGFGEAVALWSDVLAVGDPADNEVRIFDLGALP